ncbi:hypothetical protein GXM_02378 [Nostoc sphaeroides CCNUC1]|uniref:Uncharacterized protein n=1 Tax=Nostoc sphaeroides CCNUC1 TaxID=2653204 RepID=A0A5P8VWV2_9NOSO|nr:hypothetical protein GXM_02378 [Nostoc sphaeroides CCNUC1]
MQWQVVRVSDGEFQSLIGILGNCNQEQMIQSMRDMSFNP